MAQPSMDNFPTNRVARARAWLMKALRHEGDFLRRSVADRAGVVKENPENYLGMDKRGRPHWIARPRPKTQRKAGQPKVAGTVNIAQSDTIESLKGWEHFEQDGDLVHAVRAALKHRGLDLARIPNLNGTGDAYGFVETLSGFPEDAKRVAEQRASNLELIQKLKADGLVYFGTSWTMVNKPEAIKALLGAMAEQGELTDEKLLEHPSARERSRPGPPRPPGPDQLPRGGDAGLGTRSDGGESGSVHSSEGGDVAGRDRAQPAGEPREKGEQDPGPERHHYSEYDWEQLINAEPPSVDDSPLGEDIERGLKDALQVRDARLIHKAIRDGKRAFLLGNGTGTGKTFMSLAVIAKHMSASTGDPIMVVVPSAKHIKQYQDAAAVFSKGSGVKVKLKEGIPKSGAEGGVYITSYAKLRETYVKGEKKEGKSTWKFTGHLQDAPFKMIVFDEVHRESMKADDPTAQTAQMVKDLQGRSAFNILATATPFESPLDCYYLWSLGMWGDPRGDVNQLQDKKLFKQWAKQRGVVWFRKLMGPGKGTQDVNPRFVGGDAKERARAMLQIRADLITGGLGIFREFADPANPLAYESTLLSLKEGAGEFNTHVRAALKALDSVPHVQGIEGAIRKVIVKRLLDYPRLPVAAELAIAKIKEGQQVVILTQFHAPLDFSKIVRDAATAKDAQDALRTMAGGAEEQRAKIISASAAFAEVFKAAGLEHVVLPGPVDYLKERIESAFGPGSVVTIAGQKSSNETAGTKFNAGEARCLVGTIGGAGTGLSLHDTKGDAPRFQINASVPWTGKELQQMVGRTYREGTASKTTSHFLFVNSPWEKIIASVTAARVQSLNAGTKGRVESGDSEALAEYLMGQLVEEAGDGYALENGQQAMAKARLVLYMRAT